MIAQIGEIAHGLASDAGIRWGQVTFAAVGSPGVYEPGRGEVALAYSLPGWGRQGLVELVQRELGTKTEFENDVNLAALGERWHGLGKDVRDFVYLHLGTGVGLGIIVNGELYRGSSGAAGEVGYLPLWRTDVRDPEGRRRGPLDIAASAAGVVEAARRAGITGPLTAERVFTAASRGDRRAVKVVAQEAERIALAIAAVSAILDPELVILGGGHRRQRRAPPGARALEARRDLPLPAAGRGLGPATRGHALRLGLDGAPIRARPTLRPGDGLRMSSRPRARRIHGKQQRPGPRPEEEAAG